MTTTIDVAWGPCAPMRPEHVLTKLQPYGVNVRHLAIDVQPEGSIAHVTVNDTQARVAEYWLLRSGLFGLMTEPIDPDNIKWASTWHTLPVQKGCHIGHTATGTIGRMPEPGRKRARQQRTTRRTRQQDSGILNMLARLFR